MTDGRTFDLRGIVPARYLSRRRFLWFRAISLAVLLWVVAIVALLSFLSREVGILPGRNSPFALLDGFLFVFGALCGIVLYWTGLAYATPPVALTTSRLGILFKDNSGREHMIRWNQKRLRLSIGTFRFPQSWYPEGRGYVPTVRAASLGGHPKIFMTQEAADDILAGAQRAGLKISMHNGGDKVEIRS